MNVAIIAAAGRGTRMGGEQAKQFRELAGTPIIIHTLRRFEQCRTVGEVIAVVPSSDVSRTLELAEKYAVGKLSRVVAGGETRAETVWRGLQAAELDASPEIVAIHDGVRPLVTPDEIDRTVSAAGESGAAILATRVVDTIKEADGGGEGLRVARTCERARLWHAQTPQCFRYELLRRAYERALAEQWEATDDSALVERLGASVSIIEGSARNIKITTPQDIALAEVLIQGSEFKAQS
jgi:2-C-methyl-D-erythritol 4-phosphate cytidylyltransferase